MQHKGEPDLDLAAELVRTLPAPVILSGGMREPGRIRDAFERTGARRSCSPAARWATRGSSRACSGPAPAGRATRSGLDELDWVMDRAAEHLGEERAARYLRKFYPWYVDRLGRTHARGRLQRTASLAEATATWPVARPGRRPVAAAA